MSEKRCSYCGKLITNDKTYCNNRCKIKYDRFQKYESKRTGVFRKIFNIMILMFFAGLILAAVTKHLGVIVIILAAVALFITIIVFPFATPEIVKSLGIKKSKLTVRIFSIILILWIFIFMKIH